MSGSRVHTFPTALAAFLASLVEFGPGATLPSARAAVASFAGFAILLLQSTTARGTKQEWSGYL
jgi:hypothetical protein